TYATDENDVDTKSVTTEFTVATRAEIINNLLSYCDRLALPHRIYMMALWILDNVVSGANQTGRNSLELELTDLSQLSIGCLALAIMRFKPSVFERLIALVPRPSRHKSTMSTTEYDRIAQCAARQHVLEWVATIHVNLTLPKHILTPHEWCCLFTRRWIVWLQYESDEQHTPLRIAPTTDIATTDHIKTPTTELPLDTKTMEINVKHIPSIIAFIKSCEFYRVVQSYLKLGYLTGMDTVARYSLMATTAMVTAVVARVAAHDGVIRASCGPVFGFEWQDVEPLLHHLLPLAHLVSSKSTPAPATAAAVDVVKHDDALLSGLYVSSIASPVASTSIARVS
ncbi:MAG TPA: hypothetical protein VM260_16810, partial [Pirellula sp.]|nr:hypothetical protein [Pirellula sp.]